MTAPAVWDRRAFLGGSDVAAVLGISKRADKTPLALYLEKTADEPVVSPDNNAKRWGRLQEDVVALAFAEETGRKVTPAASEARHPDFPFLVGHVDRLVDDGAAILECKTSRFGGDFGEEHTDELPEDYLAQVHFYLELLRVPVCHVAVLVAGQDLLKYEVQRDPEVGAELVEACVHFWKHHVQARRPPDPIHNREAARRWRATLDKTVAMDDAAKLDLVQLVTVRQQLEHLEKEKEELELRLKLLLEDATALVDARGVPLVTWKASTSQRFDMERFKAEQPDLHAQFLKTTETRRFLITKTAKETFVL